MFLLAFLRSPASPPTREEFERAALPHLPEIYRTAVGLLGGNRTEAEDLSQEVFLEAWKSFHRFEPGTNIRAWLHKILVRRASRFRKTARSPRSTRQASFASAAAGSSAPHFSHRTGNIRSTERRPGRPGRSGSRPAP